MVLVVPGKRNVLLSDVLVTSCVAVYTKYKQSDQGACWCVPLSGTFHFAMEQCLKRKLDSVLEVFSFLFFFFFFLHWHCVLSSQTLFILSGERSSPTQMLQWVSNGTKNCTTEVVFRTLLFWQDVVSEISASISHD